MSLYSKFSFLFKETCQAYSPKLKRKSDIVNLLQKILKLDQKFNLPEKTKLLQLFLLEDEGNMDILFDFINNISSDLNPLSIIQLFIVIHNLLSDNLLNYSLAVQLKNNKIQWLKYLGNQSQSLQEPLKSDRNEPQILTIETESNNNLDGLQFCGFYYIFLQRIALNFDLYQSIKEKKYPYTQDQEQLDFKLMLLWLYKSQNIMNQAATLLNSHKQSQFQETYIIQKDMQAALYNDMQLFQSFICEQILVLIDQYVLLPACDTLSLHEIYLECNKNYEFMLQIHQTMIISSSSPKKCQIPNNLFQEFQSFIAKLKVLNQSNFKKSIKVPTKNNPYYGMQYKNPNIIHIRGGSDHINSEEIISENTSPMIDETPELTKRGRRIQLQRGQSTFQQ